MLVQTNYLLMLPGYRAMDVLAGARFRGSLGRRFLVVTLEVPPALPASVAHMGVSLAGGWDGILRR